ncbi:carbonic anhydrase family protein, partial [Pseudonocardia abyssalis]
MGPQQSPIALSTTDAVAAPELPELVVDYPRSVDLSVRYVSRDPDDPTGCTTRGREETIEAEVPAGAAGISLDGVRYELEQFHFHTGSEHTLDGRRFPVEQHFVHKGPNDETLVIGRFLDGGGPGTTAADRVLDDLPEECGEEVAILGADLAGDLPADLSTLRYPGSLTTKPNTEGVSWLVFRTPGALADETIADVRELFPDGDARDLQPLDGRVVRLREQ